jgi:cytochrome c biogenesis protein CcdA
MERLNRAFIIFGFVLFLLFVQVANSAKQVTVKFYCYNPNTDKSYCGLCDQWRVLNDFLEKNNTLTEIAKNYTGQVSVVWKEFYTSYNPYIINPDVYNETVAYNATDITGSPEPNSIVIIDEAGNFTTFVGYGINQTLIKQTIDAYLAGLEPPEPSSSLPLLAILAGAFSFGFLETFSPCLMILLSFVLSYSIKETTSFREGFLKVMTFGAGFVFATILVFLGSVGLVIASSAFAFQNILMYVVLVLAVFFGVDLLGLDVSKYLKLNIETKSIIQKLSRKFVITYAGLVILGFLFYFLDPCVAPVFVVMLGTFQQGLLSFLPLVVSVFCFGVLVPFIGVGVLAGSISRLTRSTYRYRSEIRAISGIILIFYAIYFIGYIIKLGLVTTLIIDTIAVMPIIVFVVWRSLRSRHARSSRAI